jgi:hypothetical protein
MSTLSNELKAHFASKEELLELTKAMATTTDADVMITIDYDVELQKEVFHNSPFLRYIEANGIVQPASTNKVGYRVKKQNTTSSFIGETEDIPAHIASNFSDEVAKMKTLVYPVEISDLGQNGVDAIDLLEDEITDGFLDMAVAKDKAIIQGTGENKDFKGLIPSIKTNKEDLGGEKISLKDIDIIAQSIIDSGGSPSAILTTASVGRQLNDLIADRLRYVDKIDLEFGHRVTAYNAPNGAQIPILVDPNIDKTKGEQLVFVDNNSIRMRELLPPSMIDLAKTKLSTSKVLYTWFTFYNRAEYRNGLITGIGSDITKGGGETTSP